jgi:Flp pilus assembly protein TadG
MFGRTRVGFARERTGDNAQSFVEFALVLPLLLILVFGIIDFGMGLRTYIGVSTATREGARYGALGSTAGTFISGGAGDCDGSTRTTIVGRVCSELNGMNLDNLQSVTVTYPSGKLSGNSVHVSAEYRYEYITPVRRFVSLFTLGALDDDITLTSTTDMRLE